MIACKLDLLYYIQKVSYTCVLLHNHSSFCTFIVKSLVDCFFESVKLVTNKECISAINIYFELFAWRESVTNIYVFILFCILLFSHGLLLLLSFCLFFKHWTGATNCVNIILNKAFKTKQKKTWKANKESCKIYMSEIHSFIYICMHKLTYREGDLDKHIFM